MPLIEKLKILQGDTSDRQFALAMGIGPDDLCRLYKGTRPISRGIATRIIAKYPELVEEARDMFLPLEATK
jgi:hypothetical protein